MTVGIDLEMRELLNQASLLVAEMQLEELTQVDRWIKVGELQAAIHYLNDEFLLSNLIGLGERLPAYDRAGGPSLAKLCPIMIEYCRSTYDWTLWNSWADRVIASPTDDLTKAQILFGKGRGAQEQGRLEEGAQYHQQALALLPDDPCYDQDRALNWIGLGTCYQRLAAQDPAKWQLAQDYLAQAIDILERIEAWEAMSYGLGEMAGLFYRMKQYQQALEWDERSLKIARDHSIPVLQERSWNRWNGLGWIYLESDQIDRAEECFANCLSLSEQMGLLFPAARARYGLGVVHVRRNQYKQAERLLKDALPIFRRFNAATMVGIVYHVLGQIYIKAKRHDEALFMLRQSLRWHKHTQLKDQVLMVMFFFGILHEATGECDKARIAYEYIVTESTKIQHSEYRRMALDHLDKCCD
jgi:tetratricopeptide (TPR) repeat protein